MRYRCLVLDHDDTAVQSETAIGYPFFLEMLAQLRPNAHISLSDYVSDCHHMGFVDMCRKRFAFTPQEQAMEHQAWMAHIRTHIPDPYPGFDRIIRRQRDSGGLICVVSHSSEENILRDYRTHFGISPDAIYGWDLPEPMRKPHPYPLEDIMQRFSLTAGEILVVDDAKLSWDMAHPLGIAVAFAAWSKGELPELTNQMSAICDYTFHTPGQLENFLFD